MQQQIESLYPIDFRHADTKALGEHIRHRHVVELIGVKRVGISNFLRFFLYHKDIVPSYINHSEHHIFIPVDLNDLVERTILSFWTVMFKRLVDAITIENIPQDIQQKIANRFLASIQTKDVFMMIETIRDSLSDITNIGILPTFFFIRFDRLKDVANAEFFSNLKGLQAATDNKVSYVFTSYRHLAELFPDVSPEDSFSLLSPMYIQPADDTDMRTIFRIFDETYHLNLPEELLKHLLLLSGGHVQYLQLFLIKLNEKYKDNLPKAQDLISILIKDERIRLLSQEIWESLSGDEQEILKKIVAGDHLVERDSKKAKYLWETGIVRQNGNFLAVFSSLFSDYIEQNGAAADEAVENNIEFTKKEHLLFSLLEKRLSEICDREMIIENVWPEYQELGVSDWTLDRLIARLRTKLKQQNSAYTIVTVKTRGFKLVKE